MYRLSSLHDDLYEIERQLSRGQTALAPVALNALASEFQNLALEITAARSAPVTAPQVMTDTPPAADETHDFRYSDGGQRAVRSVEREKVSVPPVLALVVVWLGAGAVWVGAAMIWLAR